MDHHLATYLNDHLAGATAGIEIAQHLIDSADGSAKEQLSAVKAEIEKDHETLKSVMNDLNIGESSIRKTAGWLAEKATELKLHLDDPVGGRFRAFEGLELLSLGIEGKRCLWLAISAAAECDVRLRRPDLSKLAARAEEQRRLVETLRLETAQKALADPTD